MSLNGWLVDLVLVVHLAFVLFVVAGGFLVLRWPRLAWVHVPATLWGIAVEYTGWMCPLTLLENVLRASAGLAISDNDFLTRAITQLLYPVGLTRQTQLVLGTIALGVNAFVYWMVWRTHRTHRTYRMR